MIGDPIETYKILKGVDDDVPQLKSLRLADIAPKHEATNLGLMSKMFSVSLEISTSEGCGGKDIDYNQIRVQHISGHLRNPGIWGM